MIYLLPALIAYLALRPIPWQDLATHTQEARHLGATARQAFWLVWLPLAAPRLLLPIAAITTSIVIVIYAR